MTLRQAHALADEAIAQNVTQEDRLTTLLNAQIDAGLSRLLGVLRTVWPTLTDTGSLQLTEQMVTSALGNALYIVPNSRQSDYRAQYAQLVEESYEGGLQTGSAVAAVLLGDFTAVNSEGSGRSEKADDAVRRLYNHVEDFRRQAIAAVLLLAQNGQSIGRVQDVVSAQAGKVKGKAQGIAAYESHDALIAGVATAYALMGEAVEYVVWNTSQDERVCPICLPREGNVYKKGSALIPNHVRCRCFFLPYSPRWDDPTFRRENHESALRRLTEDGRSPSYSVSSFERAAGLTEALKPFLRASD